MSDEPRGQMVPLKAHYDPRTNPWDPSYDPASNDRGAITGRTDNPQPRKEN
jgi:hypothetical protein